MFESCHYLNGTRKRSPKSVPILMAPANDTLNAAANPFVIPNDDQVFQMREAEREAERRARVDFNSKTIWEKSSSTRQGRPSMYTPKRLKEKPSASATGEPQLMGERRRDKENMVELIAKKREMFLVQMSLDTKRREIQKLEEKAKLKEEALRKSELMLEADAARFDKFLKENDRNAHEAIKRHDDESKIKHEKLLAIKKLNHEIAKVQSDMSKYQEQLEDCLKYQEFLDKLTPPAEKEAMQKTRQERMARREAKGQSQPKKKSGDAAKKSGENVEDGSFDDREVDELEEIEADDDDVEPIYFKEPSQLLQIFSALEERNLFLIQNSQETEEALEDLKTKFEDTKQQMEANTSSLSKNIEQLQQKIEAENDKASKLEKRMAMNVGIGKQEAILQELGDKVTEVFTRCGFIPEANPDTLDKLAEIERKLEQLLEHMSVMPKEYVRAAEKRKEAERRDRVRKQKMFEKQHAYEERLAKSVARATAAIPHRKGKKIMFRSPPLKRKKKKVTADDKIKQEQEIVFKKYFT